ncbi:MAG: EF-hand domain-containing protein [Paracoccaceae bacterium]
MPKKHVLVLLALALGAGAIAVPAVVAADDRGRMMGGAMMGGMGPGFDFAEVDADGDGKITAAELQAHRNAEVAGLDADGDNLISVEELTAHMAARMQDRVAAAAKARVEAGDLDGDGKLSVEEMMAPPMAGRMFARFDADGDGAVSQEEIAAMQDRFQRMGGRMDDDDMRGHRMKHGNSGWGWWSDDSE